MIRSRETKRTGEAEARGRGRGVHTARAPLASGAALAAGIFLAAAAFLAPWASAASINPVQVEAHHPFTLALSYSSGNCASILSHRETRLIGGKLVLSALDEQSPNVRCAGMGPWDSRAEFTAPALDSGEYPVQIRWDAACEFSATPCPAGWNPIDVGTLQVTDSSRLGYHFTPRTARAGKAFTLLLQGGLRCGDEVTGHSADASTPPTLSLGYTVDRGSGLCDTIVRPLEFEVPALSAGIWQVSVWSTPYCAPGAICPLSLSVGFAGALDVEPSTEAIVPWRREFRTAPAGRGPGFRAGWGGSNRDAAGRIAKPFTGGSAP